MKGGGKNRPLWIGTDVVHGEARPQGLSVRPDQVTLREFLVIIDWDPSGTTSRFEPIPGRYLKGIVQSEVEKVGTHIEAIKAGHVDE